MFSQEKHSNSHQVFLSKLHSNLQVYKCMNVTRVKNKLSKKSRLEWNNSTLKNKEIFSENGIILIDDQSIKHWNGME